MKKKTSCGSIAVLFLFPYSTGVAGAPPPVLDLDHELRNPASLSNLFEVVAEDDLQTLNKNLQSAPMGTESNKKKNKTGKQGGRDEGNSRPQNEGRKMITDARFSSIHFDPRFQEAPKRNSKVKSKSLPTSELEESSDSEEDDSHESNESSLSSTIDSDSDDKVYLEEEDDDAFMQQENIPEIDNETPRHAVVNLDWNQVRAIDLYALLSSFLPKGGQIMSVAVYPSDFGLKRMEEEAVHGPVGLFDDDDEDEQDDEIDRKKLRAYELSRLRYYYAVVECDSSATADYLYKTCDGVEFERSSNKLDLRFIPDTMEFKHQPRDMATEAPTDYEGVDFQTRALQHSNIHITWDEDEPQRSKTLKRKLNAEQLDELELKEFLASDESEADDDADDNDMEDRSVKICRKQDMYGALVQSGDGSDDNDEDNAKDMEVTFNTGLEDISKRILEKDKKSETVWESYLRKRREKKKAWKNRSNNSSDEESSDTERKHEEELDDFFVEEETQVRSTKRDKPNQEAVLEAEAGQAELELLLADDMGTDNNLKGYNLKPKKGKGKKVKEIPDEGKIPDVDYDDPRFSSLFTSPLFALDPTDPQFKRSAVYARQMAQKKRGKMLQEHYTHRNFRGLSV
ncbi:Uncharacterized protein Fot_44064 [Forsythia ovata]|uniref:NUC153 domain-containing protein n=1 Tax=Forsythia ovata TaxID=205694 RepID=A0ABD1R2G2_9LAMI